MRNNLSSEFCGYPWVSYHLEVNRQSCLLQTAIPNCIFMKKHVNMDMDKTLKPEPLSKGAFCSQGKQ